eukprot:scaffold970_cov187-Amphora_coffeaeformis.AAC.4
MAANVPPAVANANANACLNHAYQGGHVNAEIDAARASKRRKTAETLCSDKSLTEQELGQQEAFYLQKVTSALPPEVAVDGAPAWFANAMAVVMAPINAKLQNMAARQENAVVQHHSDALQPLCNADGNTPPNFPATYGDLNALTDAQRAQLLQFYGRSASPIATREQRLKQFLGIRP